MPKETPGINIPLSESGDGAGFELSDLKESVKFNIKNIILTHPGERTMDPDFGVGIQQLLFEHDRSDLFESVHNRIKVQIGVYAPYVTLLNLEIHPNQNTVSVIIEYEIDYAEIVDLLELELSNTNANNLI